MGTDDPGERDLHQGLIKLAAAFVHATRGNSLGIEKNLRGSRELLAGGNEAGASEGIDVPRIISAIDDRLAGLERSEPLESAPRTAPMDPVDPIPVFPAKSTPGDG